MDKKTNRGEEEENWDNDQLLAEGSLQHIVYGRDEEIDKVRRDAGEKTRPERMPSPPPV